MTQPVTYYAQSQAIDRFTEKYGPRLELLTRNEKLVILAKLTEMVSKDAQIWMRTGLENLSPNLRIHLLDLLECSESQLLGVMLAIVTQLHDKVYAQESR